MQNNTKIDVTLFIASLVVIVFSIGVFVSVKRQDYTAQAKQADKQSHYQAAVTNCADEAKQLFSASELIKYSDAYWQCMNNSDATLNKD